MSTDVDFPDGLSAQHVRDLVEVLVDVSGGVLSSEIPIITPAVLLGHLADPDRFGALPAGHARIHESLACKWHRSRDVGMAFSAGTLQSGKLIRSNLRDSDGLIFSGEARIDVVAQDHLAKLGVIEAPANLYTSDVVWHRFAPLTAAIVKRYVTLAQDPNPIHLCEDAAHAVGLSSAIVPGLLLAGLAEYATVGDWSGLRMRFIAPVPVGSSCRFAARRSRVFVVREDNVLAAIVDMQAGT